jgi:hypothetical protein
MKTTMRFLLSAIGLSVFIMFAIATIKDSYAGGDDLEDTKYNITVFRGDGIAEVDSWTGEEKVIKKPTERTFKTGKRTTRNGGTRILGAGDGTLWLEKNGHLYACTTIGNGYTGGGQRITCSK